MSETTWDRAVYDPAAEHSGLDGADAGGWLAARREAMDIVVAAIAESSWVDHLVLRGSALLKAWFGDAAREPGDLDFVVTPVEWRIDDAEVARMLPDIAARAAALSRIAGTVRIDAEPFVSDIEQHIWTYNGVPGCRLELTWECPERGRGDLHLDFAFGEELPETPVRTAIARLGIPGPAVTLRTATRPLSLAWKLLWLGADMDEGGASGKDLYDAVLLAEHCTVPRPLLDEVLDLGDVECYWSPESRTRLDALLAAAENVEWDGFAAAYPHLDRARDDFIWRLVVAVAPVFPPGLETLYEHLALTLTDRVTYLRNRITGPLPDYIEQTFAARPPSTVEQLVVTRELMGRESTSLRTAADAVAAMQSRRTTRPYPAFQRGFGDPHRIAAALEPQSDRSPR